MNTRKLFAGLTLVVITGVLAASCTPAATYDTEIYGDLEDLDPSGQTVVYWHQHSRSREEALLAMVDDFNSTNEWGITVQAEYQGGYDEIYNKFVAGIPSNELPDMTVAYQNQAATYVTQGALVELTPYIESEMWGFTQEDLDDLFPFVDQGDALPQFANERYGFPPQRSMEVLFYNEDWLRDLGYDAPPRTWAEFKEMACAASDPDAETYGYELSIDTSTFADWVFNRGGAMLSDDATEYVFGEQPGIDALNFIQELFNEGCAILETEAYADQTDFGAGKVLFTISSTSGLPYYRSAVAEGAGFNWSIAPMPTTLDTPKANIYGASLSVVRSTPENQLAAWLFIRWLTDTEQSARWARASNYFPVRQSAADLLGDYFAEDPQFEKAFGFLGYDIAIEPGVAGYDECRDSVGDMLSAVAAGADVTAELANAVSECNEFLEEASPE